MKLHLTKKDILSIFHTALCNGLSELYYHGIDWNVDNRKYSNSKKKTGSSCLEDNVIQLLKDKHPIQFIDTEGGEYNVDLTIEQVYKNLPLTPIQNLINIINETDDAYDADAVLQTVLYGEIIFG